MDERTGYQHEGWEGEGRNIRKHFSPSNLPTFNKFFTFEALPSIRSLKFN
jgi:hypothetical protein